MWDAVKATKPGEGTRPPATPTTAWPRCAASLTRISRLLDGTITPHAMKYPDDKWARFVLAQATSLQSTLDMLANGSAPVGG